MIKPSYLTDIIYDKNFIIFQSGVSLGLALGMLIGRGLHNNIVYWFLVIGFVGLFYLAFKEIKPLLIK